MSNKRVMIMAAGLAISSAALADSEWANAVSGDWSAVLNWDPAHVPDTSAEIATIAVGPGGYAVRFDALMPAETSLAGLVLSNPDVTLNVVGGKTLAINGVFANEGMIGFNSTSSSSDAVLRFDADTLATGGGAINLLRPGADSQVQTAAGAVLTNDTMHTIMGQGTLGAALVNLGLVDASVSGGVLGLVTNDKTNAGTFRAGGGGVLEIGSITLDNTNGLIRAEGGSTVRFASGTKTVVRGQIESTGTCVVELQNGGTLTLESVSVAGAFDIRGGGTLLIAGGLVHSGTMTVNSNLSTTDAIVRFTASGALAGPGTVRLNRPGMTPSWWPTQVLPSRMRPGTRSPGRA